MNILVLLKIEVLLKVAVLLNVLVFVEDNGIIEDSGMLKILVSKNIVFFFKGRFADILAKISSQLRIQRRFRVKGVNT